MFLVVKEIVSKMHLDDLVDVERISPWSVQNFETVKQQKLTNKFSGNQKLDRGEVILESDIISIFQRSMLNLIS